MSRTETLYRAVSDWLRPDNGALKQAIEKSVDEGLFAFSDIKYQILALKRTLTQDAFDEWLRRAAVIPGEGRGRTVLVLNAGNLPLVGVHDLIGVTLSGANYCGKLSSKDPYLLPTLLESLQNHLSELKFRWNIRLDHFNGMGMDAVIYTGSDENEERVTDLLHSGQMISKGTPILSRTTHFSVAWIESKRSEVMEQLTNAMLRYGGRGCRSAAMVVAPFGLMEEQCLLTDHAEQFWVRNPLQQSPSQALRYRYAYNKASGVDQIWLHHALYEERKEKPVQPFVVHWVKGDESIVETLLNSYQNQIQSLYAEEHRCGEEIGDFRAEPLGSAQEPPLWWKPDRIDTLEWLSTVLLEMK